MRFGSVCSGIEAASVAFHSLGWRAAWFSEIEPFPSAVLAHHYPGTPNLGDMTGITRRVITGEVEAPDVLCGGTPCQAFSVAGLRESLSDERGNLTMTFCEIADAIDFVRGRRGEQPAVIFWENVPGVLSTRDNAFGCFLAGLAGEDAPLEPPGGKWANAGCVYGPARAVAWRTLDAQYFGLAQRRRRVFVVASARNGFDPAQVLFEWDGVRRDSAPSREAGKDAAGCLASRTDGGGFPGTDEACGGYVQPVSAFCIKGAAIGRKPEAGPQYGEVLEDICYTQNCVEQHAVAHTLRGEGFDASEDGTGRGTPLVPEPYTLAIRGRGDTHALEYRQDGTANALLTPNGGRGGIGVGAIAHAFDARQSDVIQYGDRTGPLDTDGHTIGVLAFSAKDHGADAGEIAPTLRAMGHGASHANGGGQVAVACIHADAIGRTGEAVTPSADAAGRVRLRPPGMGVADDGSAYNLMASGQPHGVATGMAVRRLTPAECERLQGFPDGYTAIPWRGKPADLCPDGPRYKALGNSWAVPVVRWIGERIQRQLGKKETGE